MIDIFEQKGGREITIEEYRQYIKVVSGLKVDVADEISIPFPQRDVHLYSDQPVKINSLSGENKS